MDKNNIVIYVLLFIVILCVIVIGVLLFKSVSSGDRDLLFFDNISDKSDSSLDYSEVVDDSLNDDSSSIETDNVDVSNNNDNSDINSDENDSKDNNNGNDYVIDNGVLDDNIIVDLPSGNKSIKYVNKFPKDAYCVQAIDEFYKNDGVTYYFTCKMSQYIYVNVDGIEYGLVDALENKIVTIEDVEKAKGSKFLSKSNNSSAY